jgi:hypothetical protein
MSTQRVAAETERAATRMAIEPLGAIIRYFQRRMEILSSH